jgi:hypothetical protein
MPGAELAESKKTLKKPLRPEQFRDRQKRWSRDCDQPAERCTS